VIDPNSVKKKKKYACQTELAAKDEDQSSATGLETANIGTRSSAIDFGS
jgi:hypothetical protein